MVKNSILYIFEVKIWPFFETDAFFAIYSQNFEILGPSGIFLSNFTLDPWQFQFFPHP